MRSEWDYGEPFDLADLEYEYGAPQLPAVRNDGSLGTFGIDENKKWIALAVILLIVLAFMIGQRRGERNDKA